MSRSRAKKYRNCKTDKNMKRFANKKVRRTKWFNMFGSLYKRLFQSWNINDGCRAKPTPKEDIQHQHTNSYNWIEKARRK